MDQWILWSILAMFGTAMWNINLINIKKHSNNKTLTWFRIVLVVAGILSLISFYFFKPDININELKWLPLIYSGILLLGYQILLLYAFSSSLSAFPLIIVNLNIAIVFLYQVFIMNKPLTMELFILLLLYIVVGSMVIYKKQ